MPITHTNAKYCFLSLFGALVVVGGVLALTAPVQAQSLLEPSIDKSAALILQVGQSLTCTIDAETPPFSGVGLDRIIDPVPAGVMLIGAASQIVRRRSHSLLCFRARWQVMMLPVPLALDRPQRRRRFRITIEATAEQCRTLINTSTASDSAGFIPYTVSDTVDITVVAAQGTAVVSVAVMVSH